METERSINKYIKMNDRNDNWQANDFMLNPCSKLPVLPLII